MKLQKIKFYFKRDPLVNIILEAYGQIPVVVTQEMEKILLMQLVEDYQKKWELKLILN